MQAAALCCEANWIKALAPYVHLFQGSQDDVFTYCHKPHGSASQQFPQIVPLC